MSKKNKEPRPAPGTSYDADGNLLNDSFHSYTWDSDSNPATIDAIGLTYDAFDRVVEQNQSGTYYQIVYTPIGTKLGKFKAGVMQQVYVPLPGGANAEYYSWGLSNYRHADWLGSDRMQSDAASRSVTDNNAYAPFGEPYAQTGNGEISFTGQNKDTVWLQYDFLARQYDPKQGRWISPDPAGMAAVDPINPQSWNRYAYVGNNPLTFTDPLGLFELCTPPDPNWVIISASTINADGSTNCPIWGPPPSNCFYNFLYGGGFGGELCGALPPDTGMGGSSGSSSGSSPSAPNSLTPKGKGCQAKVQAAVNKALGTNATYQGPTTGLNDPTYGPGWRNGAYNFNFFAAGYTGSISPGNCGRFAPSLTGTGGSLHIIVPTGGCNPAGDPYINPTGMVSINGQYGFQFTAHIDSAYAYSPWGAIQHFIEDVLLRRPHGC